MHEQAIMKHSTLYNKYMRVNSETDMSVKANTLDLVKTESREVLDH